MGAYARLIIFSILSLFSTTILAFTPASGTWAVTSEFLTGKAGRGFQIIVENDILVFSLYGYNQDGSGNFFIAAGPLVGNQFTGALDTCRGGMPMGGVYHDATCTKTGTSVKLSFNSGETGTITFPGEAPKSMTRFNFGYGMTNGPAVLYGSEFLFSYRSTISGIEFTNYYNLSVNTGSSSQYGNGIVTTSDGKFACEFMTILPMQDSYFCAQLSGTYPDVYIFKLVGDRGNGIGGYQTSTTSTGLSNPYPLQVFRLTTSMFGTSTGPYDSTATTTTAPINRIVLQQTHGLPVVTPLKAEYESMMKAQLLSMPAVATQDTETTQALTQWVRDVSVILAK